MSFKEFVKMYEPNLGRYSVNYFAWFTCDKNTMEWLKGIYYDDKIKKKFKKEKKHDIMVTDYHSGKQHTIHLEYNTGNIEEVIPFTMFLHPCMVAEFDMGFLGIPNYNKLLCGEISDWHDMNNMSFVILDNDHWPALRRESIIIIQEDVVE